MIKICHLKEENNRKTIEDSIQMDCTSEYIEELIVPGQNISFSSSERLISECRQLRNGAYISGL